MTSLRLAVLAAVAVAAVAAAAPRSGAGAVRGAAAGTSLYIVRFHERVSASAPAEVQAVFAELYGRHGSERHEGWHAVEASAYRRVFHGASVWLSPAAAAWLGAHPAVADVEADATFHIPEPMTGLPPPVDFLARAKAVRRAADVAPRARALQTAVRTQGAEEITGFQLWNLDRSDQPDAPPYSDSYSFATDGAGVDVYVVDSGIRQTHIDFGGRAIPGFDGINDGLPQASDCNGHGTHVAGTVGGSIVGIAKNATLIAVRVFGCTGGGSTAVILNALEWVSQRAAAQAAAGVRSVVNMSLGGGRSTTFDAATNKLVREGIVVVVAAGNENQDAANASPAAAELAIAVGATDIADAKASFSNFGPVVDIQAPGVNIFSAYHTGDAVGQSLDGTSMAAPAVAGMAARYLQQRPTATPAEVREALLCSAQRNTLTGLPADGTPNALMFSTPLGLNVPNADGSCGPPPSDTPGPPPSPPPPVACPNDCSGRGSCRSDGTCACVCGWMGADCRQQLPFTEGQGLSGSVAGSTTAADAVAVFGQESRERFVALTVPAGVTAWTLSTCAPGTNYDTQIWLLAACPGPALSNEDVVAVSDDGPPGSCAPPAAPLPPYTRENFPPPSRIEVTAPAPGRYYVMVEGYQGYEGDFVLSWTMAAPPGTAVPSASPSAAPLPTASTLPVPSSGLPGDDDDAFDAGEENAVPGAAAASLASAALLLLAAVAALMA